MNGKEQTSGILPFSCLPVPPESSVPLGKPYTHSFLTFNKGGNPLAHGISLVDGQSNFSIESRATLVTDDGLTRYATICHVAH